MGGRVRVPARPGGGLTPALTLGVALTLGLALTLGTPPAALAEPPLELTDQVTDHAGVLSPAERSEIGQATADLASERGIDLYVVYVDTFDGASAPQWAIDTFESTGLGDVVLAVAVQERVYGYHEDTSVSTAWAQELVGDLVEPELRDDHWAGAALGMAEGYRTDEEPVSWGLLGALGTGVLALVGVPTTMVVRRRWRERRELESAILDRRRALAAAAVELEELTGSAGSEADYAEADLDGTITRQLRERVQRGRDVVGSLATVLADLPSSPGRWPSSHETLDRWRGRLRKAEDRVRVVSEELEVLLGRVRTTRQLLDDPGKIPALLARVEDLGTRCADTRELVSATGAGHPAWLVARLAALLDGADQRVAAARETAQDAQRLFDAKRPVEAGRTWTTAREVFDQAEGLLALAADPHRVAREAVAQLQPQRGALEALISRGRDELARDEEYHLHADEHEASPWSSSHARELTEALARARRLLAEPAPLHVDPDVQAEQLSSARRRLTGAMAPYQAMAIAVQAAADRARDRSSSSGPSSSSSSSSSSSGSSSSSSSSSSASSGGGRF